MKFSIGNNEPINSQAYSNYLRKDVQLNLLERGKQGTFILNSYNWNGVYKGEPEMTLSL